MAKTYQQLQREIADMQALAEKLRLEEVKGVIARINEAIAAYDLQAADLDFHQPQRVGRGRKAGSAPAASRTAPYSDGQGNSWGGRGPRPAWLRAALEAGHDISEFAAAPNGRARPAKEPGTRRRGSPIRGSKLPPKFKDPASEATWSGRGSQPNWLREALRKRGARLEDFLVHDSDAAVGAQAVRSWQPISGASSTRPAAPGQQRAGRCERCAARPRRRGRALPRAPFRAGAAPKAANRSRCLRS